MPLHQGDFVTLNGQLIPAVIPMTQLGEYFPDGRIASLRMRNPSSSSRGRTMAFVPKWTDSSRTKLDLRPDSNGGATEYFLSSTGGASSSSRGNSASVAAAASGGRSVSSRPAARSSSSASTAAPPPPGGGGDMSMSASGSGYLSRLAHEPTNAFEPRDATATPGDSAGQSPAAESEADVDAELQPHPAAMAVADDDDKKKQQHSDPVQNLLGDLYLRGRLPGRDSSSSAARHNNNNADRRSSPIGAAGGRRSTERAVASARSSSRSPDQEEQRSALPPAGRPPLGRGGGKPSSSSEEFSGFSFTVDASPDDQMRGGGRRNNNSNSNSKNKKSNSDDQDEGDSMEQRLHDAVDTVRTAAGDAATAAAAYVQEALTPRSKSNTLNGSHAHEQNDDDNADDDRTVTEKVMDTAEHVRDRVTHAARTAVVAATEPFAAQQHHHGAAGERSSKSRGGGGGSLPRSHSRESLTDRVVARVRENASSLREEMMTQLQMEEAAKAKHRAAESDNKKPSAAAAAAAASSSSHHHHRSAAAAADNNDSRVPSSFTCESTGTHGRVSTLQYLHNRTRGGGSNSRAGSSATAADPASSSQNPLEDFQGAKVHHHQPQHHHHHHDHDQAKPAAAFSQPRARDEKEDTVASSASASHPHHHHNNDEQKKQLQQRRGSVQKHAKALEQERAFEGAVAAIDTTASKDNTTRSEQQKNNNSNSQKAKVRSPSSSSSSSYSDGDNQRPGHHHHHHHHHHHRPRTAAEVAEAERRRTERKTRRRRDQKPSKWVRDRADALRMLLAGLVLLLGICIAGTERDTWMSCGLRTMTRAMRGNAIAGVDPLIGSERSLTATVGTHVYVAARAGLWESCVTASINLTEEGRLLNRWEDNLRHALRTVREGPQRSEDAAILTSDSTEDWILSDSSTILTAVGFEDALPVYQVCRADVRDHRKCQNAVSLTFTRMRVLTILALVVAGILFISIILDLNLVASCKIKINKFVLAFCIIFIWSVSLSVWVLYVDSANIPSVAGSTHAECELEANLREVLASFAAATITVSENATRFQAMEDVLKAESRTEFNVTEQETLKLMRANLSVVPVTWLRDRVVYFDDCGVGFSTWAWLSSWVLYTVLVTIYTLSRMSSYKAYSEQQAESASPFNPMNMFRTLGNYAFPTLFGGPSDNDGSQASTNQNVNNNDIDSDSYTSSSWSSGSSSSSSSGWGGSDTDDARRGSSGFYGPDSDEERMRRQQSFNNRRGGGGGGRPGTALDDDGFEDSAGSGARAGGSSSVPISPSRRSKQHRKGRVSGENLLSQTISGAIDFVKSFAGPPGAVRSPENPTSSNRNSREFSGNNNYESSGSDDDDDRYNNNGGRRNGPPPKHRRRRSSGSGGSGGGSKGEGGWKQVLIDIVWHAALDKVLPYVVGIAAEKQKVEAARLIRDLFPDVPGGVVNIVADFMVEKARDYVVNEYEESRAAVLESPLG